MISCYKNQAKVSNSRKRIACPLFGTKTQMCYVLMT